MKKMKIEILDDEIYPEALKEIKEEATTGTSRI